MEAGNAAAQQAAMVAPSLSAASFLMGGGAALQDLSDGDTSKAGTWGKALVDGVVTGSLTAVAGKAAGYVLGKTAIPLLNWAGQKILSPIAEKIGGALGSDATGAIAGEDSVNNGLFSKGVNFVQNLIQKIPKLFSASSTGDVAGMLDQFGRNVADKQAAVTDQFNKAMTSNFNDGANLVKDDVEETQTPYHAHRLR